MRPSSADRLEQGAEAILGDALDARTFAMLPLYWLWSLFDRDTSARLYPVKLERVVRALADAVEQKPDGVRVIEAPEITRTHRVRSIDSNSSGRDDRTRASSAVIRPSRTSCASESSSAIMPWRRPRVISVGRFWSLSLRM